MCIIASFVAIRRKPEEAWLNQGVPIWRYADIRLEVLEGQSGIALTDPYGSASAKEEASGVGFVAKGQRR
jgi:hypothetical protein